MNAFENKSVYFVSDSNLTKPYYLEYLRADFLRTGKCVYLRNKGIPGARMDMVENCIDEELSVEKPDFVALCFGGNDLGIWLYDCELSVTEEIEKERESRIKNFVCALEKNIEYLRARKIEPIFLTPVCYNENIIERANIQTDKDSKEKAVIKNSLFTKKTFQNINKKLQFLSDIGKDVAKKYDVIVWDLFSATKVHANEACFEKDGVHYNEKGHYLIAREIYKNMFGTEMGIYPVTKDIKELSQMEAEERAYFFVKYNLVFLSYGYKERDCLCAIVERFIAEKGYTEGLTLARADGFFRFVQAPNEKQLAIIEKIRGLLNKTINL